MPPLCNVVNCGCAIFVFYSTFILDNSALHLMGNCAHIMWILKQFVRRDDCVLKKIKPLVSFIVWDFYIMLQHTTHGWVSFHNLKSSECLKWWWWLKWWQIFSRYYTITILDQNVKFIWPNFLLFPIFHTCVGTVPLAVDSHWQNCSGL